MDYITRIRQNMYLDDQAFTALGRKDHQIDSTLANKPVADEFQSFVVDLIAQQKEQITQIQARNKCLANRILDLHEKFHEVALDLEHRAKGQRPIPGKKDILSLLYPDYPRSFDYSLCLSSPLDAALSKKKYIIFDLYTSPHHSVPFNQCSTINLVAELYSSHFPPRSLSTNKKGAKLLLGTTQNLMKYCAKRKCYSAYFKLKVSEVTSHYMNGWIFIVIRPESLETFPFIKPLILKKVVVSSRSLRLKKRR
jgi:hypothetical protein